MAFWFFWAKPKEQKKSSITKSDTRWDDSNPARFSRSAAADGTGYPVSFVTGQVMTIEKQIIIT
ncbi:hypothetical protein [Algoriphagus persicinus]|uniref:hypothetical protein n=1 Tax=Algoriphagus persicinus TaxID=3108754 RepID=UPI002B3B823C|nr:hypothetical protein [Algoriphagus sp. E1-3-M2]MEB2784417.1 hypothetical protein [Algoriphagus sp. E1-3-M2]